MFKIIPLQTAVFRGKADRVYRSRNSCKDTIFAPELLHMYEDEVTSDLRGDGVTYIRRITVLVGTFCYGQRRDTNLLLLTLSATYLPETLAMVACIICGKMFSSFRIQIHSGASSASGLDTEARPAHRTLDAKARGAVRQSGSARRPKARRRRQTAPKVCLSCDSIDHTGSSFECAKWKRKKYLRTDANSGLSKEARRQVKPVIYEAYSDWKQVENRHSERVFFI